MSFILILVQQGVDVQELHGGLQRWAMAAASDDIVYNSSRANGASPATVTETEQANELKRINVFCVA